MGNSGAGITVPRDPSLRLEKQVLYALPSVLGCGLLWGDVRGGGPFRGGSARRGTQL